MEFLDGNCSCYLWESSSPDSATRNELQLLGSHESIKMLHLEASEGKCYYYLLSLSNWQLPLLIQSMERNEKHPVGQF